MRAGRETGFPQLLPRFGFFPYPWARGTGDWRSAGPASSYLRCRPGMFPPTAGSHFPVQQFFGAVRLRIRELLNYASWDPDNYSSLPWKPPTCESPFLLAMSSIAGTNFLRNGA